MICDSGPGIAPDQQQKLFRPFSQGDRSISRIYGGSGLGLLLSQKLARALGGDLVLKESRIGAGSTFLLRVDGGAVSEINALGEKYRLAQNVKPIVDQTLSKSAFPCRAIPVRILLVEDSYDNRVLISRFLKTIGAEIDCAEDGEDGVRRALARGYDLVFMDIQMPKMDGLTAVKNLRGAGYRGPVVALTAHAMKGDREACIAAGFDDHLIKPVCRSALAQAVERYAIAPPSPFPPSPPSVSQLTTFDS